MALSCGAILLGGVYLLMRKGWLTLGRKVSKAEARWMVGGFTAMCLALTWMSDWGAHLSVHNALLTLWLMLVWMWSVTVWFSGRRKEK
jgi:hypothetical protein